MVSTEWMRLLSLSTPMWTYRFAGLRLHPEIALVAFFVWCISGSRSFFLFLVELVSAIKVASMIVQCFMAIPMALR